MESDIVARLRALVSEYPTLNEIMDSEWTNAADEINRLRARIESLRMESERLGEDLTRCRYRALDAEVKAQERGRLLGQEQARVRHLEEQLQGAKNELALLKMANTALDRKLDAAREQIK